MIFLPRSYFSQGSLVIVTILSCLLKFLNPGRILNRKMKKQLLIAIIFLILEMQTYFSKTPNFSPDNL